MTDLPAHADTLDHLERAIARGELYRLMLRATMDQLHNAHAHADYQSDQRDELLDALRAKNEALRLQIAPLLLLDLLRQIAELRAEIRRYGVRVFQDAE